MWTRGLGLISNSVCLWPLCTDWDLCSIFICLHIYNLQVTLDIMNTWFCYLLSLICLSILSSENLYGHEQSLKITMKKNVNQTKLWLVKIHDHCLLLPLRSQVYGGRFILRAVFLPFTGTMGPQFQLTVRVSLAAIWVAVSAPSPHIPGDRDQLPGARCSHQGLRGARGAATNIRMSLQPMFTVSPARYNHNSMEISRVILIVQWWCSCLKYALFYLTLTS